MSPATPTRSPTEPKGPGSWYSASCVCAESAPAPTAELSSVAVKCLTNGSVQPKLVASVRVTGSRDVVACDSTRLVGARAIRATADWYLAHARGEDMRAFTLASIEDYMRS